MNMARWWMTPLVVLNLIASILHGGHNILFFEEYPEPPWITGPHVVDLLYVIAMPFLFLGWWFNRQGRYKASVGSFLVFCLAGLSAFGHYRYGRMADLSFHINLFIFLQGVLAGVLLLYVLIFVPWWAGRDPSSPS